MTDLTANEIVVLLYAFGLALVFAVVGAIAEYLERKGLL